MARLPNFSLIHAGCPEFSVLCDYIFPFLRKENERNWTFTGDFPGGMEKWDRDGLLYPPIFSVRFSPPENLNLSLGLDTLRDEGLVCSNPSIPGPAWGRLLRPQNVLSVSLTVLHWEGEPFGVGSPLSTGTCHPSWHQARLWLQIPFSVLEFRTPPEHGWRQTLRSSPT